MKKLVIALMLVSMLTSTLAASGQPPAAGPAVEKVYIVQMIADPVASYRGGVMGYRPTAPLPGRKIDPNSPAVQAYAGYLETGQDEILARVGGKRKLYSYHFSYNGFAAKLTAAQAALLAKLPGVAAVSLDAVVTIDTASTPAFLGLDAPGGLWEQLGGTGLAGDGVIIGVIDTGIWPESPSFSDRTGLNGNGSKDGKLSYQQKQIPGWHGRCVPGEGFNASMCNQKLVGAQYFNAGLGGNAWVRANLPWEFNSPRDYNGHGTHTASTAGGNPNVALTGPAAALGSISGIAPHARLAIYKALWSKEDGTASGAVSDLVAAIDQAVADGVDIINYSVSGTQDNFQDPVEIAFLYAARAGIFVAASAGNNGPAAGSVAHPSPWVTTVAASTHNRSAAGSVTLGNGTSYSGASLAAAVSAPLLNAAAAALPGADPTKAALCYAAVDNRGAAVLDPAKTAGKIIVCERGVTDRTSKSQAVLAAGGVGMLLVNTEPGSLNADLHFVPTVHLQSTDRAAIQAYAATPDAIATIQAADISGSAPAPFTAAFSARGPLQASADLLKPDLIAPGQDILAAVAPPGNAGRSFELYSGTSMSSPHVAGLAALLKQAHPTWSPMMIKSAMMTTGSDVLDSSSSDSAVIFSQGAGQIQPNRAVDPGLVFNSGWNDWLGFLCGTQLPAWYCTSYNVPVLDPSDFNSPSIVISGLAGSQTVTRRVTNVARIATTYTSSYAGMSGVQVVVNPASLTLQPGETRSFTVTFTAGSQASDAYTGGQLTWQDGSHVVRIPLLVQSIPLTAPAAIFSTGAPASYDVTFGYSGPFSASPRGLTAASTYDGAVKTGDRVRFSINVPAGSTHARFSLFDAYATPGSDLDLYVYLNGNFVGYSGSYTTSEEVDLPNPIPGLYTVEIMGYTTSDPSNFSLFAWILDSTAVGNMAVSAPSTAVSGSTTTITLTFSGLTPGIKYLGSVAYAGTAGLPAPTLVRVDLK